ncbi:hypothetical protein AC249_AIPGENE6620, partial [Exaiptasia diaphana]
MSTPMTEFLPTIRELVGSIKDDRDEKRDKFDPKEDFLLSQNPKIVQTAGQVDLIFSIEPESFRYLFRYNSWFKERHVSCQWVLCKELLLPEEWGVKPPPTALDVANGKAQEPLHCYYSHLRVSRDVYRRSGMRAEQEILEKLAALLKEHKMSATILAATGWSDLVIQGGLEGDARYCDFISDAQKLDLEENPDVPVFQRTVSLLGYSWNAGTQLNPQVEAKAKDAIPAQIFSFRVRPGYMDTAFCDIGAFLDSLTVSSERHADPAACEESSPPSDPVASEESLQQAYSLHLTTGKSDLLAVPAPGLKIRNLHLDPDLRGPLDALAASGVESIETTISALEPERVLGTNEIKRLVAPTEPTCGCTTCADGLLGKEDGWVGDTADQRLPSGIRESIGAV